MKILYISDSSIPSQSPNSVHVMKMCQALSKLGNEVILWGKNTEACIRNIRDFYSFYSIENSFKLFVYPRKSFKGSGQYYNISLPFRLLFVKNVDLYYTRSIFAAFFLALYQRKFVYEIHEPFESKGLRLRLMNWYILRSKSLVKLVVISEALKHFYLNLLKGDDSLLKVAHDGADPFPEVEPIVKDNTFKVGYVGSLLTGKGMEILIPLSRMQPKILFHVVGGNENQILKIKRDNPELENIIFHGFKSQKEIPQYIKSFDVLIAPYTENVRVKDSSSSNNLAKWMSPLKVFEYMSAGKPIVASSLPVIREILENKEDSILCNPNNLTEWVDAINLLKVDIALRERISKNALSKFLYHYTWTQRADTILKSISI